MNRYLFLHYVGQYLLPTMLIIELILLYKSNVPYYQDVGPIPVKSNDDALKFNPAIPPLIISHITDTHINTYNSTYGQHLEKCLKSSILYQPDVLLHTGDAVDNFCTDQRPKYGDQCSNDFTLYDKIISKYKSDFKTILGTAGNHDMFGIFSFDSPKFHFLKTARKYYDNPMQTYDEFLVSNYPVKVNEDLTINFISMNPFRFPTAHPSFMYYAHTWREFLDRLENVIQRIPVNDKIIFYSHYPQSMYTSITNTPSTSFSTRGRRIKDLIERPNTIAYISGHTHSKSQLFEHHGLEKNCQYLESIGNDIKDRPTYEIVTIDNLRVVYHQIQPNNQNKCLITYPVPVNQTTVYSYIDDENAPIRMVCFSEKEMNIEIHGDIEGQTMKMVKKLKDNVYLYEFSLQKIYADDLANKESSNIIHHLKFGGDWKGEIEFYTRGTIPQFKEPKNNDYSKIIVFRFTLPFIFVILFYVTFPYTSSALKIDEQSYFNFLQKGNSKSYKNWFLTVSGLCTRLKIQRLNKSYRYILCVAVLWPLLLPISLMETEDHYGFIWTYGYYINGMFRYSEHGQDFAVYYYLFVMLPLVLASAVMGDDLPLFGIGGIEAALLCVVSVFLVCRSIWFVFLFKSAGPFCQFISVYTLGLVALFPCLFYNYYKIYKNRGNRNSEWYAEGMSMTNSFAL